jgi:signal transduction histidine kinase
MNIIQNFFSINHGVIYFIYGLMFFVVGLAIALQSRLSSRLDLARSLKWLAFFGFLHGFHEWGDLFIPLQAEYLPSAFILVLHYIHLGLLASSFICLFEFGFTLLEPLTYRGWLHILAAGIFIIWTLFVVWPLHVIIPDYETWHVSADALARYFIGLPGGLLAAYGLRRHTLQRIAPYNVPRIVHALEAAGIAMALYALAAGLIVPAVPFFPGNWLNSDTFTHYLLIPPQLIRAVIGLAIAVTTIRFLEIFNIEISRQIEKMEKQQILAVERERIARDLHDGAIQKVYTAGLLVRSAQNLVAVETPLAGRLSTAVGVLDDAIGDLRQNLMNLNEPDQLREPFISALRKLATDPRFISLVEVSVKVELPESEDLPSDRCVHVLAIVREALANAIRHSHARHVQITAGQFAEQLQLIIQDDGIGIPAQVIEGNGLRNMRDRATLLHGQLSVKKMDKGTQVMLNFPCQVEQ